MESHSQDWPGEDPVSVLFTAVLLWFLGPEFTMGGEKEEEEGKEAWRVSGKGGKEMNICTRGDVGDEYRWRMGMKGQREIWRVRVRVSVKMGGMIGYVSGTEEERGVNGKERLLSG